jgi:hypothetical protein
VCQLIYRLLVISSPSEHGSFSKNPLFLQNASIVVETCVAVSFATTLLRREITCFADAASSVKHVHPRFLRYSTVQYSTCTVGYREYRPPSSPLNISDRCGPDGRRSGGYLLIVCHSSVHRHNQQFAPPPRVFDRTTTTSTIKRDPQSRT